MNVLFLTQSTALGPSSRYRVYQLLPVLEKLGIRGDVSPAINDELYSQIHLGGRGSRLRGHNRFGVATARRTAFAATWRKRQDDLRRLGDFDGVVVQKGVFPGLYAGFERRIARERPLVIDFDDAIWLPRQGGAPVLRALHRESSVQAVLRRARAVIAGNEFLASYARRFNDNVTVVPTVVDLKRYPQSNIESRVSETARTQGGNPESKIVLVGWIGSRTTLPYLKPLAPVFQQLGITPRVIASGDPSSLGFDADFVPWRLETEIRELQQLAIGLAPLPDTPWERGKCGVKLLQYMACGIPVVASAVGVHRDIVRHGENGLLVTTEKEWCDALHDLLQQPALRQQLGQAGRRTVEQRFDIPIAAQKVAVVLKTAAQS